MPDYSFEHIHLVSQDPATTAGFYVKHLGAVQDSVVTTPSGARAVRLKIKDTMIIISPPRANSSFRGLEHFGIITDDMPSSMRELKAAGCTFHGEPVDLPDAVITFFSTPENVLIELLERKKV